MRRSTIVILLLAVIAVGIYYFFTNRQETEAVDVLITPEPASEIAFLFDAAEGVPSSIRIESKAGEVVEVIRNAENVWTVAAPSEASADQGLAEAAASQVAAMRILDKIQNVDLEVLGLKSPEYSIRVRFTGDVERKADVGVITPSESGYYVRTEQGEIVIVSRDALDTLLGMLTNPPYAPTPTLETATPTP
jgi:hypothetical protein